MENFYNRNGLVFWSESDIVRRTCFETVIHNDLMSTLKRQNQAFQSVKVEAPILTPVSFINQNYTDADYYSVGDDLVLRPETTMGSYECAKAMLSGYNDIKYKPPIVVWQHGKSFRKEQDQPTKFMRLKEFYQLEFQIIYNENTKNDYTTDVYNAVLHSISGLIADACKLEDSDRLPEYSLSTKDVVCGRTGMELCSMSIRKDFAGYKVLEVAVGTDRMLYSSY